jgi:hypothetical protein
MPIIMIVERRNHAIIISVSVQKYSQVLNAWCKFSVTVVMLISGRCFWLLF